MRPERDHQLWLLTGVLLVDVPGKLAGIKTATTLPVERKTCSGIKAVVESERQLLFRQQATSSIPRSARQASCGTRLCDAAAFLLIQNKASMRQPQCFNEASLGQTFYKLLPL